MSVNDFLLASYDYQLPEALVAQYPCKVPGSSRLLVTERKRTFYKDALFRDLPRYLPKDALLVANNAKVLPARIKWQRESGGKAEFLLLTPLPVLNAEAVIDSEGKYSAKAEALLKPGSRFHPGQKIHINTDLWFEVLEKGQFGHHQLILHWQGNLDRILDRDGSLPLPPYIKREVSCGDQERYQTIYASKNGAMAAPTAGLHFTGALREELLKANITWQELTLYVGYGTFSPVRCEDIRKHAMHREYVELDTLTAESINRAIRDRRPVVAVGTTSLRALEGIARKFGEIREYSGWVDIFIYPGFNFKIVNALITNFHLPKSSLLMLVSAFAGRNNILDAYSHAIKNAYRFFSYGDAMLIL